MSEIESISSKPDPSQALAKPTPRQWLTHLAFFLATAFTTTICGIMMAGPELRSIGPPPGMRSLSGSVLMIPWYYVATVFEIVRYAIAHPQYLVQWLKFSGSLLAILTAHESGAYPYCFYN